MIESPCSCPVPTWHAESMASCTSRYILSLPSASSSQNRDSSIHPTYFQSSTLQSLCTLAQARRVVRWRALSNGTLVGRRLPKSIYSEASVAQSVY
ncbi:hypothetical protein TNCV_420911 [Trichonephila clavipes]|nr:hypothetical protein TNCV_420911 [Trichonephila clavipes]